MKLDGIAPGTRLITVAGDVVELIEVNADGSAKIRYAEVLGGGAAAAAGTEDTLYPEDIATVDDNRFVGPGQTASSAG